MYFWTSSTCEGDGKEEEQDRGDHLGQGAHLLERESFWRFRNLTKKTTSLTKGCWPTVAEVGTVDNIILFFIFWFSRLENFLGFLSPTIWTLWKSFVQHKQCFFKVNYIFCHLMLVGKYICLIVKPDSGVPPKCQIRSRVCKLHCRLPSWSNRMASKKLDTLIWVILRCWGNSSILCQQNFDAL